MISARLSKPLLFVSIRANAASIFRVSASAVLEDLLLPAAGALGRWGADDLGLYACEPGGVQDTPRRD